MDPLWQTRGATGSKCLKFTALTEMLMTAVRGSGEEIVRAFYVAVLQSTLFSSVNKV